MSQPPTVGGNGRVPSLTFMTATNRPWTVACRSFVCRARPTSMAKEPDRRSAPAGRFVVVYYASCPVLLIAAGHVIG